MAQRKIFLSGGMSLTHGLDNKDKMSKALDRGKIVEEVHLDIRKTFDARDHPILL